ncbi:MAG: phenylacetate--CoA ligase family protein [Candidatus Odyssella sp.]|nr:phenylacetate--CoA ligase family protein [Candidatus Odyssella sp.]
MTVASQDFRSNVPGLTWPALPDLVGAGALALQYQLQESEQAPPARIRARQFRQIAALLDHSFARIPFYRARLERAGYAPGMSVDEAFWRRLPILTRQEAQDAGAALCAREMPGWHGEQYAFSSGGSTGRPVNGVQTELHRLYFDAVTLRNHLWHRRDLTARLAVIRFGGEVALANGRASAPGWNRPAASAFRNGPSELCDLHRPIAEQLAWLAETGADYLLTYPSLLRELVLEAARRGVSLPRLRGVVTFGEVLDAATRALVRERWRLAIGDTYSATETGYLALQCPGFERYHVQAETCLVEILDDAGAPCAPGETGRVVATPLHNFAMPLLRYDVGDYAEAGQACPCGRTLPVLNRILGRARNTFRRRDGSRFWPAGISLSEDPVRQFQIVETAPWQAEARLVTTRPLAAAERAKAAAEIAGALLGEYAVRIVEVGAIARSPSGKYEDFVALPPSPAGAP